MTKPSSMLIGVVSDTHGLLRPELLPALAGVDHILHAGDVGDPTILTELSRIAPVTAIRGNIDTHGPCSLLPATEAIELAGSLIYILHSLDDLDLNPFTATPTNPPSSTAKASSTSTPAVPARAASTSPSPTPASASKTANHKPRCSPYSPEISRRRVAWKTITSKLRKRSHTIVPRHT
jgi:hypothetical protein